MRQLVMGSGSSRSSSFGFHGPPGFGSELARAPALGQGTVEEIEDLLDKLPEEDAEEYAKRLEGCLEQLATGGLPSVLTAYKCIDSLYDDVRAAVKAIEDAEEAPKPVSRDTEPKPPAPQEISPWLIVGGLVAAGFVGYLALK